MYRYKCNLCAHTEDREEKSPHIPRCPECDKRGVWGSLHCRKLKPRKLSLSDMGVCQRCGKLASTGEWIDGKWYGPECKDKIFRGDSSDERNNDRT